jgi:hypothetical protein
MKHQDPLWLARRESIDETLKRATETCAQAAATVRESQRLRERIHRERLSHERHDVGH